MTSSGVVTVTIDRIGAEGDGIATAPDGSTLYIPDALPGETVRSEPQRRRSDGWLAPHQGLLGGSEARVPPPCRHFPECGGCVLQHWRDAEYRTWKTDLLAAALRRAGYTDPPIAPLHVTPPRSRRRMDLAVARRGRHVLVGLHRRRDDAIVDLVQCDVLAPELTALIAPLRDALAGLHCLRRTGSAIANLLDGGIDLLLRTETPPEIDDRQRLIALARAERLLRVSCGPLRGEPEPIAVLAPPRVTFAGVTVEPPPGVFLQASRAGEAAIVDAVFAGLPDKLPPRARIAELFAGSGTITFALAQRAPVTAWEGDDAAVTALRQAANRGGLAGRVTASHRDLTRRPLMATELAAFAAVVLDPPFGGAAAQTAQIAAAKPTRVIYVSCNPAALAGDARILREAGYELVAASPIDQFLWSARIESVCVFAR